MTYASSFKTNQYPANTVKTSGSILLVQNLSGLDVEPVEYTITAKSSPSSGATSLDLLADSEVTLRDGETLTFSDGNYVILDGEQTIPTSSTSITVEAIDTAPAVDETAPTWAMRKVLSPTALPLSGESSDVDRKDYSFGLQGQNIKTRIDLTSSVEIINQTSDQAYQTFILPASMDARNIFVTIVTGAEHAWGPCQISAVSDDNALEELSRPSFDVSFQSPWARAGAYSQLSSAEQDAVNNVRKRCGLAVLS